jgi:hypothetical protein
LAGRAALLRLLCPGNGLVTAPSCAPRQEPAHARAKCQQTLLWAFFAGCIVAIPIAAAAGRLRTAGLLIAVVMLEVLVLLANRWRCPLTDVAARYTADRRDNFDIYLPRWLARHNKSVFGTLFAAGAVYTLICVLLSR